MSEGGDGFRSALVHGARELGIVLEPHHLELFEVYVRELLKWNRKVNLTSLRDEEEVAVKHFLDSLTVAPLLEEEGELLDLGTGAGFPGLVLKIYSPSVRAVLLDASQKRVFFLRHLIRILRLKGVEVLHGRAEDPSLRRKAGEFSLVVSRAFASLEEFLRMAIPYTRKGGKVIAMKGPRGREELCRLREGLPLVLEEVREVELPRGMGRRLLILFRRT